MITVGRILIFFLLGSVIVQAQSIVDSNSVERKIIEVKSLVSDGKYNNAVNICDSVQLILSNDKDDRWLRVTGLKGIALVHLRNFEKAEIEFSQAYQWIHGLIDPIQSNEVVADNGFDFENGQKGLEVFDLSFIPKKYIGKIKPNSDLLSNPIWINNLAVYCQTNGYFDLAESLYMAVLILYAKAGKSNTKYSSICMSNFAFYYLKVGAYERAEPLFLQSIEILKRTAGQPDIYYAIGINNLALLYYKMGAYEKAEPIYVEAKSIFKKLLGTKHSNYAVCLNNLAGLYQKVGSFEKAEILYLESLEIRERSFGNEHQNYAVGLNNLAALYIAKKEFDKASNLLIDSRNIFRKNTGANSLEYANVTDHLATVNLSMGLNENAEILYLESKNIRRKVLGQEHPDYATSLHNLGYLNRIGNDLDMAADLYLRAKVIREKVLGRFHPVYCESVKSLAEIYFTLGDVVKAQLYITEFYHLQLKQIKNAFSYLSEQQKEKFILNNVEENISTLHSFGLIMQSSDIRNLQYDMALFYKGLQLSASLSKYMHLQKHSNSNFTDICMELMANQRQLDKQYGLPVNDRRRVGQLEIKREELEKLLIVSSPDIAKSIVFHNLNHNHVRECLRTGEVAVEFINFDFVNPIATDSVMYIAAVVLAGEENVQYVPLFEQSQLESLMKPSSIRASDNIRSIYRRKLDVDLYQLIWQPIDSLLQNVKTVYYSPSGLLHRLNMAAFPVSEDKVLSDEYNLVNVSSTRILAIPDEVEEKQENRAYVVGGVNYNFDSSLEGQIDYEIDSVLIEPQGTTQFTFIEPAIRAAKIWEFLEGTQKEAASIKRILKESDHQVEFNVGKNATEESFKRMGIDSKSPRVIHLASHGFFFSDPVDTISNIRGEAIWRYADKPMLRSGIIMAGANRVWGGADPLPDREDGILTAYEISNMNLSNTELVVLSACETGLGDIKGSEGVYGLQRAFKKAGATYLMMSLWRIPDKETAEFMTTFYSNWLEKGMKIPDAFNAAQRQMRERHNNPYHWAAFVLVQ